jgi:hypothetical protein
MARCVCQHRKEGMRCLRKYGLILSILFLLSLPSYSDVCLTETEYEEVIEILTQSEMELIQSKMKVLEVENKLGIAETKLMVLEQTLEMLEKDYNNRLKILDQVSKEYKEQEKSWKVQKIVGISIIVLEAIVTGIVAFN